jgi:hypothetical protein
MNDLPVVRLSFSWLLLPLAMLLVLLGWLASPRNAQGRPVLLLPDVKAVKDYQRAARDNAAGLRLLDGEIAVLLEGQSPDLFTQSRQAQVAFQHALTITQRIDTQSAPPALDGLRQASAQTASSYLEASRLALRWVSIPQESNRAATENELTNAQQELQTLEASQWLQKTSP